MPVDDANVLVESLPGAGKWTVNGVVVIDCVVHRIEHVAPDPDFGIGPDVANDLGSLLDVPCEEVARGHFLALASGALVHDPEFVVGHEKGCGMKEIVGLFYFISPVVENSWFAQTTGDAIFVNNDRMVIADAEFCAFGYPSVRREFDDGRIMVSVPWIQDRIFDGLEIAAFFEESAVFSADGNGATRSPENVHEANFLDLEIVPPKFSAFARPRAEIEAPFLVIEAVEDELILFPILSFLNVKRLRADGMLGI
jgi:hypothetical protein